jgi:UDP-glucose-4-epimerase GalE
MVDAIIVTGGAGYIGSHTCKALAAAGYRPVAVDSLEQGHRWAVRWGPLEVCAVHDQAALRRIFTQYAPRAVIHFAAHINVGESNLDPLKYYRNNLGGLIALVEVMQDFALANLVFSSTAAVYGQPQTVPIPESHPTEPINSYGASKLMGERILADLAATGRLRSVSLRYFNAAGADPDGEIGEAHDPETHLIPLALRAAMMPERELSLFGDDYDTPDGTALRDYIHVRDLAAAHVSALRYLEAGGETTALNLGTGRGYSVREVIETVAAVVGNPVRQRLCPRRAGDPDRLVADPGRAITTLDWQAKHSALETIVRTALAWEKILRAGGPPTA